MRCELYMLLYLGSIYITIYVYIYYMYKYISLIRIPLFCMVLRGISEYIACHKIILPGRLGQYGSFNGNDFNIHYDVSSRYAYSLFKSNLNLLQLLLKVLSSNRQFCNDV